MRDKVTMSPLPHPPTFAKSQPPWPWGLSCVLLFFLGHSSCLGGASQPAQGISPSATCARLAWEQRKGLIYDINDSEHMWLDKISCHVQYALLVPPDTWQCWELQVFHHPPPLSGTKLVPKSPRCLVRVSLQHSFFSHPTNSSQHLSTSKSYELSGELPQPRLAQCLKGKKFSYLREAFQSIK